MVNFSLLASALNTRQGASGTGSLSGTSGTPSASGTSGASGSNNISGTSGSTPTSGSAPPAASPSTVSLSSGAQAATNQDPSLKFLPQGIEFPTTSPSSTDASTEHVTQNPVELLQSLKTKIANGDLSKQEIRHLQDQLIEAVDSHKDELKQISDSFHVRSRGMEQTGPGLSDEQITQAFLVQMTDVMKILRDKNFDANINFVGLQELMLSIYRTTNKTGGGHEAAMQAATEFLNQVKQNAQRGKSDLERYITTQAQQVGYEFYPSLQAPEKHNPFTDPRRAAEEIRRTQAGTEPNTVERDRYEQEADNLINQLEAKGWLRNSVLTKDALVQILVSTHKFMGEDWANIAMEALRQAASSNDKAKWVNQVSELAESAGYPFFRNSDDKERYNPYSDYRRTNNQDTDNRVVMQGRRNENEIEISLRRIRIHFGSRTETVNAPAWLLNLIIEKSNSNAEDFQSFMQQAAQALNAYNNNRPEIRYSPDSRSFEIVPR